MGVNDNICFRRSPRGAVAFFMPTISVQKRRNTLVAPWLLLLFPCATQFWMSGMDLSWSACLREEILILRLHNAVVTIRWCLKPSLLVGSKAKFRFQERWWTSMRLKVVVVQRTQTIFIRRAYLLPSTMSRKNVFSWLLHQITDVALPAFCLSF